MAGHPLSTRTWERLCAMADSAAALVDERSRPPRQGDSDEGRALVIDAPVSNSSMALLALAETLVGRLDWWLRPPADVRSSIVGSLTSGKPRIEGRPRRRLSRFADAGITLLRTTGENEIWCRCDSGPHGYLSIAAHAHADALSVEVRYAGMDILADPGTYCYHGEREWRSYFRSTIAHNTAEVDGRSQSSEGGPFMWVRHAHAWEVEVSTTATSPHALLSMTAIPRLTLRGCTAARCCWTGRRAVSTSSTRSTAVATTSALPSTSVPRSEWSSTDPGQPSTGRRHQHLVRHAWNCRLTLNGPCTGARPIPSSAGTPAAWGSAYPHSPSSDAGVPLQAFP